MFEIEKEKCIGCGLCQTICPNSFKLENGLAQVINEKDLECDPKEVISSCPCEAIKSKNN